MSKMEGKLETAEESQDKQQKTVQEANISQGCHDLTLRALRPARDKPVYVVPRRLTFSLFPFFSLHGCVLCINPE
jgi:hypothetical protein